MTIEVDRPLPERADGFITLSRSHTNLFGDAGQLCCCLDIRSGPFGLPAASALAKRHVSYGVKAEHYPVVGDALLWTLEKGLRDRWTPQVADAWGTVYGTLSGYMISEAYGRSQAGR